MTSSVASWPYAFGTFSVAGCAPFPALVRDGRALALAAIHRTSTITGAHLSGAGSLAEFIENWSANLQGIDRFLASETAVHAAPWAPLGQLRTHAPLPQPRQILCTGANYRQHVLDHAADFGGGANDGGKSAQERLEEARRKIDERAANGTPYAFAKLPSAVIGPQDDVVLPHDVDKPDWELELAVVIGRPARRVSRHDAMGHVAGYMVANDITARDRLYRPDMRTIASDWLSSKSPPTFLPMGPYLVPAGFVGDPSKLHMTLALNGQTMQDAFTSDMIFDIARQIEYVSNRVTLWPGDVLLTGSPAGNGTHHQRFLQPGDLLACAIEGIGRLDNRCVAEPPEAHGA